MEPPVASLQPSQETNKITMPKNKEEIVEATSTSSSGRSAASTPKGEREARWAQFLENAKEQNPVKFALKEKAGEFAKIPDRFR